MIAVGVDAYPATSTHPMKPAVVALRNVILHTDTKAKGKAVAGIIIEWIRQLA